MHACMHTHTHTQSSYTATSQHIHTYAQACIHLLSIHTSKGLLSSLHMLHIQAKLHPSVRWPFKYTRHVDPCPIQQNQTEAAALADNNTQKTPMQDNSYHERPATQDRQPVSRKSRNRIGVAPKLPVDLEQS